MGDKKIEDIIRPDDEEDNTKYKYKNRK